MNLLRRLPMSRLFLLCAVAVMAVAGVAIAATSSNGSKPPPATLAGALRSALSAPPVSGVTATITLTDDMLGAAGVSQAGQPLLSGGTGRLWASADGQIRLELQSGGDTGDTEIYFDRGAVSYLDPASNTLYRLALPQPAPSAQPSRPDSGTHALPTVTGIQQALQGLMQHATVSGPQPDNVGGQPAYRVEVSPHDGGLVGGVALWWDSNHGIPLRIALYSTRQRGPVLELTAKDVTYGPVDSSVFTPPTTAKVVPMKLPALPGAAGHASAQGKGTHRHAAQATSVPGLQSALGFAVSAPASLSGRPRTRTELVRWGSRQAALLTYGKGLGGIAVLEQRADAAAAKPSAPAPQGDRRDRSPTLPTTKIGGSPGTVLATPLGTFVRFTRGAVTYTLLGSVSAHDALAAARGL